MANQGHLPGESITVRTSALAMADEEERSYTQALFGFAFYSSLEDRSDVAVNNVGG